MGVYSDSLSANMENSRNCLRRIARHDDTEFSKDSILNAMDKFVKTVNTMDETVLVPCRLMDLQPESGGEEARRRGKRNSLANEDPFALYNMLNAAKVELLWGRDRGEDIVTSAPPAGSGVAVAAAVKKGHVRRPSTASTASSASLPSDTDTEEGEEAADSGVEAEESEGAQRAAADFKRHLIGLRRALAGLTEAASDLTQLYQAGVGAPV